MTASKIVAAAASGVGGAGLDVDEVFSTYLYDGTGSAQTITNGIDLSGEGGLVWTKSRSDGYGHRLVDTVNGVGKYLRSESTAALRTDSYAQEGVTAFNSNGYSLGNWANEDGFHRSGSEYVSWTWRKAPKFFDVVTYTGDGTSDRQISHNLGSVPAVIICKNLADVENWQVYHKDVGNDKRLLLNTTDAAGSTSTHWNNTTPTATEFTVGSHNGTNGSGDGIVAYLFAHNNSDGEFGPDGDADIISCGSYTGNGGSTETGSPLAAIDVGFEPQWLMIKRASGGTGNWLLIDNMRGFDVNIANKPRLLANTSDAEASSASKVVLTNSGFRIEDTDAEINSNNDTYIYMAIRRGPLAAPDDATDVFAIDSGENSSDPRFTSNFPVDFAFVKFTTGSDGFTSARLIQNRELILNTNAAEGGGNNYKFDFNNGWVAGSVGNNAISYMWKRARGYFDIVTYSGTGSARTVAHNLGVAPEMMWVKNRDNADDWAIYYGDNTDYLNLNDDGATADSASRWNDTSPTSSVFTVGTDHSVNASGEDYISFLFATTVGVSKCGSYTGNGSTQNIDCGFSSGARFVLIKITSDSGDWRLYDTVRGIVAGDDPQLVLNNNSAELSSGYDLIDPHSSGFALPASPYTNNSGETYIFYAIA